MTTMRNILVPYDFSLCSAAALTASLELAVEHDAHLHVLHVAVLHQAAKLSSKTESNEAVVLRDKLQAAIRQASEQLGLNPDNPTAISYTVLHDVAACPTILGYINDYSIDLVVMGTHGHRGLRRTVLGSVAEETVRFAPCPVLTVHSEDATRSLLKETKRILAPIDFSPSSLPALQRARELAGLFEARLTILHVVEDMLHPFFYAPDAMSIYDLQPNLQDRAMEGLKKLYERTEGPGVEVNYVLTPGNPVREIAQFADKGHTDLVVIASHGLTGLDRALLGSVTERVVRMATCPVYTLKPPQASIPHPQESVKMHPEAAPAA